MRAIKKMCPHCNKNIYGPKGRPKLSRELVNKIKEARRKGMTLTRIVQDFHVSLGTVHKYLTN